MRSPRCTARPCCSMHMHIHMHIAPSLLSRNDAQLVILGSGEGHDEEFFKNLQSAREQNRGCMMRSPCLTAAAGVHYHRAASRSFWACKESSSLTRDGV